MRCLHRDGGMGEKTAVPYVGLGRREQTSNGFSETSKLSDICKYCTVK